MKKQTLKQYKNWKSLPMPEIIKRLPKDDRGYPVPANVMILDGKPVFAANDSAKEQLLVLSGKCSVTGEHLNPHTVRLITSPLNALVKPARALDAPVHVQALEYAMKVCPYLCLNNYYSSVKESKVNQLNKKYPEYKFIDLSVVNTIPPFMVELHPEKIELKVQADSLLFVVHEVINKRYWRGGEVISKTKATAFFKGYMDIPKITQRIGDMNLNEQALLENI